MNRQMEGTVGGTPEPGGFGPRTPAQGMFPSRQGPEPCGSGIFTEASPRGQVRASVTRPSGPRGRGAADRPACGCAGPSWWPAPWPTRRT